MRKLWRQRRNNKLSELRILIFTVKNMNILKNKLRSRKKGFSLVEVLLALAVLGIAMLSVMGLMNATFETVSKNVLTRQALGVYSCLDRALASVDAVVLPDGNAFVKSDQMTKPSFDYVYDWLQGKTGKNWNDALFLVCISRRLNPTDDSAPQNVLQIIKCENASGTPTQAELTDLNSEGPAYFMRVYLSPQLEGRYVEMDAKGEVLPTQYAVGNSLPANVDRYALPYLPLTVDIYPYSPGSAESEEQIPVLTQFLVVSR